MYAKGYAGHFRFTGYEEVEVCPLMKCTASMHSAIQS